MPCDATISHPRRWSFCWEECKDSSSPQILTWLNSWVFQRQAQGSRCSILRDEGQTQEITSHKGTCWHRISESHPHCFGREVLLFHGEAGIAWRWSFRLRKFLKMSNTTAWQISQLRMGKAMSENMLGTLPKFFDALWCPSGFWGVYQNPRATELLFVPIITRLNFYFKLQIFKGIHQDFLSKDPARPAPNPIRSKHRPIDAAIPCGSKRS